MNPLRGPEKENALFCYSEETHLRGPEGRRSQLTASSINHGIRPSPCLLMAALLAQGLPASVNPAKKPPVILPGKLPEGLHFHAHSIRK